MTEERFKQLKREWSRDTGHLSNVQRSAQHPAYQEIIKGGKESVQLMLTDMQYGLSLWFYALHEITGGIEIPDDDRGRVLKMTHHWLKWGRENGYVVHPDAEIWVEAREGMRYIAWYFEAKPNIEVYAQNVRTYMTHDLSAYNRFMNQNKLDDAWRELVKVVNPLLNIGFFAKLILIGKLLDGQKGD